MLNWYWNVRMLFTCYILDFTLLDSSLSHEASEHDGERSSCWNRETPTPIGRIAGSVSAPGRCCVRGWVMSPAMLWI